VGKVASGERREAQRRGHERREKTQESNLEAKREKINDEDAHMPGQDATVEIFPADQNRLSG
jgi:hypothetical protein